MAGGSGKPKSGGPEQRRPRRDCPAPAGAPGAGEGVFMGARAAVSHSSLETPCAWDWWNHGLDGD